MFDVVRVIFISPYQTGARSAAKAGRPSESENSDSRPDISRTPTVEPTCRALHDHWWMLHVVVDDVGCTVTLHGR